MRAIVKLSGVLNDLTKEFEKYKSGQATLSYISGDYLYLGSDAPFNHFYFKMGDVVNAVSASMAVEYWRNKEWISMIEVIDETSALSSSGFVSFVPNKNHNWSKSHTNFQNQVVSGLEGVVIYDLYWARISFSQTLTSNIKINWVGHLFSDDEDLYSEYPQFNSTSLKTCFEAGKIDWEEQHVKAADLLIKDLKRQGIITNTTQILDKEVYSLASVSRVAQMIFTSLGDDYSDNVSSAKEEYKARLDSSIYRIDSNNDAILDDKEKGSRQGYLSR